MINELKDILRYPDNEDLLSKPVSRFLCEKEQKTLGTKVREGVGGVLSNVTFSWKFLKNILRFVFIKM